MTTLEFEAQYAWQAIRNLKACAQKRVSPRKLWLRRSEVEAIQMHTESAAIRRACLSALGLGRAA